MRVAIIMGSTSDLPKVEPAVSILKNYGVEVDVRCLSAHRAHAGLSEFIEEANNNGTEVIIAAAGMAAALDGMDALLSIVQMPSGIPVATVAINGSKNAAYLALQIIGVNNEAVRLKLQDERRDMEKAAMKANEEVIEKFKY